ncbi:ATP-binding cassette domain-containing protein [Xinfangfangia sp. D13-10-4-6]|uniref:ATP-binding cassette domain-containing protein n=1 Tax=Pseudogemmobacter hezensis TaxID=2737662 RepID=UPI0015538440|nr:ATP-binding cassette domain-containing protein [Pseudogemmobacter hezensis]NPD14916.1 ATP-binding cassette domain-containing protein [Pseudogemmobacter hezensis]
MSDTDLVPQPQPQPQPQPLSASAPASASAPEPEWLGASPLALDDPEALYVVLSGSADLFHAPAGEARLPLGMLPAETVLFGLPEGLMGPAGVVAIPGPDAQFWRLPPAMLDSPNQVLAAGIACWLGTLARAAHHLIVPHPRADLLPVAGQHAVAAGQILMTGAGTVWCDLPPEGGLLFGIEPVFGRIALPEAAWIALEGAGQITVQTWEDGFSDPAWKEAVAAFNAAMVELLPLLRGFADADEHNRIAARSAADETDRGQSRLRLGRLLGHRLAPLIPEKTEEPLLQVLRRLAARIGVPLQRPARASRGQMDRAFTLDEIARASGFSVQPVPLGPGWWRRDLGDLLLRDADGTPFSALWQRGAYQLQGAAGESLRLDASRAADFEGPAAQIFADLGAKPDFLSVTGQGLRGSGRDISGYLVAVVLGGLLGQVLPLATNAVFSLVVPAARRDQLLPLAMIIAAIALCGFLLTIASGRAQQRAMARLNHHSFRGLWDRICRLPISWHRQYSSADVNAFASGSTGALTTVSTFGFAFAGLLGLLFSSLWVIAMQSWATAILLAVLLALHLLIGWLAAWAQMRAFGQGEALAGTADSLMLQMVNGLAKLRTAAAEERLLLIWAERYAALREKSVAARRVANLLEIWLTAFPLLASIALFALLHRAAADPASAPGLAGSMAVITAFGAVLISVSQIMRGMLGLLMARPGWAFGRKLLDAQPEARRGLTHPGTLEGRIELANVSFQRADQPVLFRGLSLKIGQGEMVAIVGPSGSGKTTLLQLLLGLEQPSSGAIYLDGHDLRGLDLNACRSQIGAVLQDDRLAPGTIAEMVRGTREADEAAIWTALHQAAIDSEIRAMPMGLYTLLTDASRTLSGGQVQRIALARAFLANPAILLLDEATSALDGPAQARIMAHIGRLGATRILVAHRLSTVRHADRILVLDRGQIVEQGSHDSLMAAKGRYHALVAGQLG